MHRPTTINRFATDICIAHLQVANLTQFSLNSGARYITPDVAVQIQVQAQVLFIYTLYRKSVSVDRGLKNAYSNLDHKSGEI